MKRPPIIPALLPHGKGHHFVCYGDCCSGIAGAPHEATFASVNQIVARLEPQPDFICFLGDEIKGLVADEELLRSQWRYWIEHEMAWITSDTAPDTRWNIPFYHTTGNHTTYNALSETVFRDVLAHLPQNGPPGQEGLSYFVRRDDLLMIFVNTIWSGLGDGRVETAWLDQTLAAHADARHKLVFGHHPAYPINGYPGDYQRNLDATNRQALWQVLVRHQVIAYICSHIMAFDVQVHHGVLQILTAGAGTLPLMPANVEYLHCVQMALDADGLRYQVLDTAAQVREGLTWPLDLPSSASWEPLASGENPAPPIGAQADGLPRETVIAWRFDGTRPMQPPSGAETLLCGWTPGPAIAPLWIGFQGPEHQLCVLLSAEAGRSPHYWLGPTFAAGEPFSIQIAIHTGMGPGGFLWRADDSAPWSSLLGATPWGAERLQLVERWSMGQDQFGERPFGGEGLQARWMMKDVKLPIDNLSLNGVQ